MAAHELSVEPDISSIAPLLEWIERRCREDGLADDVTFKMTLVLEEAVTNVINYGFAGLAPPHVIRGRLDIARQRIVAGGVDNCRPLNSLGPPRPQAFLPLGGPPPGGARPPLIRPPA